MWVMWYLILVHLETVLVLLQERCTVYAKSTIRTRWYSLVTRLRWKLDSICLEIVLILTQDRCTVCAERIIGLEIILVALDGTPR
jgi:hypothetical protein